MTVAETSREQKFFQRRMDQKAKWQFDFIEECLNEKTVPIVINDVVAHMETDSGAVVSVMDERHYSFTYKSL